MMRNRLAGVALILAMGIGAGACSKKNQPGMAFAPDVVASFAEGQMGPNEIRAKQLLEELTLMLRSASANPQAAEDRVRAFLHNYRDELTSNTAALEQELASRSGEERLKYAENFSNYLGPATKEWRKVSGDFSSANPAVWRRIERMLATSLNSTRPAAAVQIQVPPRATATDMDDVRD